MQELEHENAQLKATLELNNNLQNGGHSNNGILIATQRRVEELELENQRLKEQLSSTGELVNDASVRLSKQKQRKETKSKSS